MKDSKKKEVTKNIRQEPKTYTVKHPDGHIYVNRSLEAIEAAQGLSKKELEKRGWIFK